MGSGTVRKGWLAATLGIALVSPSTLASGVQPQAEAAPLPDMPILFKQVLDNQNQLEEARNDYTYTRTESDVEIDGNGDAHEDPVRTYEVFSVHGRRVEKLVARSGQPLTRDEARKGEERTLKLIREHRKKASEPEHEAKRSRAENEKGDDDLTVSDVLRVCQFVNARREPFRGREVLAYDFEPRPGAKPRGRVESWIHKLRGSVWIDEQAKRILRLEARVNDPLKLGGGLVLSVRRGSSLVFEQALVKDEIWLPSYAEVKLSARFLLLKGYNIHQTQRFSDYKKFAVETSSEIKPPEP